MPDAQVHRSHKPLLLHVGAIACLAAAAVYFVALDKPRSSSPPPSVPSSSPQTPGSGAVGTLTNANFQQTAKSGLVLVDFWATWCGPCKLQSPIIDKVAQAYSGKVRVAKVDVDAESDLADKYSIKSIPTLLVFKDGKLAARFEGLTEEAQLSAALENLL